jgi:C_GCAxxG_C_C family probable redox protein
LAKELEDLRQLRKIIRGDMTDSEKVAQRSEELFRSGLRCAESVLLAVTESKKIQSDLIPRIATGFCSGVARTGNICGAVSGGILAINIISGRNLSKQSTTKNYEQVKSLIKQFEKKFGSVNCSRLIGCDLDTTEGQKKFKKNKLFEKCCEFVSQATLLTLQIIDRK